MNKCALCEDLAVVNATFSGKTANGIEIVMVDVPLCRHHASEALDSVVKGGDDNK